MDKTLKHNRELKISTAGNRRSTSWPASTLTWADFTTKLKTPQRGEETLAEYLKYPKSRQDDLKDVGGFVGGTFAGDRRKANAVTGRDLITLDMDNIKAGGTEDILRRVSSLGCAAAIYSTRKHAEYAPRLRVIIPLDKTSTADEYEPLARKLAAMIGIEYCDPTTFEASRLMYWPSASSDSEYVYKVYDAPFASKDGLLRMYEDWQDIRSWPQVPGQDVEHKRLVARQQDPETKTGIVGAFCRTYTVKQAMETFTPALYEPTVEDSRWTYTGGTTTGGAILYDDDKYLFSHHATDPCGGKLVNAWDFVRLQLFGDQDDEAKEGTPPIRLPSYVAMKEFASSDKAVTDLLAQERHQQAVEAFSADVGVPAPKESGEVDLEWIHKMTKDGNGQFEKTINNVVLVLENDPLLKDKIALDEFECHGTVLGALPWDPNTERRWWTDADMAGFAHYMETFYKIAVQDKLDKALTVVSNRRRLNVVKDYLEGLSWDGKPRLDTLFCEYLGAEDNRYTRAVARKMFCAAVARAITGLVKFDYMAILAGPQGIGKSTLLYIMGGPWFSDSLTTFEGKDAAELIQGQWIVEVGELTAMGKQESNAVKQFLSKKDDVYRAAYGRTTERYPRRCVFFGTSNDDEFLKDATGNRRFWPVDVGVLDPAKSIWEDLAGERDQIWAEARVKWMLGERLYMEQELEELAREQQELHEEGNEKKGIIEGFLERKIPRNWYSLSIQQQRMYLSGHLEAKEELVEREKVCASEIWTLCLGSDMKYWQPKHSIEISNIMRKMKGWIRNKNGRRYGEFQTQKGWEREKKRKPKV